MYLYKILSCILIYFLSVGFWGLICLIKGFKCFWISWHILFRKNFKWKHSIMTSLVAQMVKRLPTMRETWVQSLGGEDPLEKEMATHSSTLAWKIPWEKPGRLQSMGSQRIGHNWATLLHSIISTSGNDCCGLVAESWLTLFATPWTVAYQASLSLGIPRQEYWSWVIISFSRGSSWPRDWNCVSCIGRLILYH